MMVPIVMRASEESLKLVPPALRNGSYALGASRYQTVVRVILPAALPAIVTAIFLAIARTAGETAPLLFTAYSSKFWMNGLDKPTPFLTYYIYTYSLDSDPGDEQLAWSGALVLLAFVMVLNIGIRLAAGGGSSRPAGPISRVGRAYSRDPPDPRAASVGLASTLDPPYNGRGSSAAIPYRFSHVLAPYLPV